MGANSINIPNINIGSLITREFKRSGMTQAEFARKLNIPPSNVTRIFKKETIETSKLIVLCGILDYNFFSDYCGDSDNAKNGYSLNRDIQIGTNIESRLRNIKMTQVEFANYLGVKQPVVSRILKKESIDTGRLVEISKILSYNFFSDFYNIVNQESYTKEGHPSDDQAKIIGELYTEKVKLEEENRRFRELLEDLQSLMSPITPRYQYQFTSEEFREFLKTEAKKKPEDRVVHLEIIKDKDE